MINFDSLPKENPFGLINKGVYKAHIESAELKVGKDSGNPYLNLKYTLTDADGKSKGVLMDMISESESSVVQFKTGRFVSALGLPLQGAMELKDLGKVAVGKDIVIEITHQKDNRDETKMKAVPDVFGHGIYYGIGKFKQACIECGYDKESAEAAGAEFAADMPTEGEAEERPFDDTPQNTPADTAEY